MFTFMWIQCTAYMYKYMYMYIVCTSCTTFTQSTQMYTSIPCTFKCTCAHPLIQSTVAGGLCGEEGLVDEKEDSNSPGHNCIPLVAPSDLEDRSAFTSSHQRPVLSRLSKFTNSILKQGAGGVARSGSLASSPNTQRKMVDATVFENE